MFDFINPTINALKELIPYLSEKSKTENITKRLVLRELRDNLKVLMYAHEKKADVDKVIERLNNTAIKEAVKTGFDFNKIRKGKISVEMITDDRNKKYIGWSCEQLFDKVDEKIEELRLIKNLYPNLDESRKNLTLVVGNLYFRMKLLADFIRSEK